MVPERKTGHRNQKQKGGGHAGRAPTPLKNQQKQAKGLREQVLGEMWEQQRSTPLEIHA